MWSRMNDTREREFSAIGDIFVFWNGRDSICLPELTEDGQIVVRLSEALHSKDRRRGWSTDTRHRRPLECKILLTRLYPATETITQGHKAFRSGENFLVLKTGRARLSAQSIFMLCQTLHLRVRGLLENFPLILNNHIAGDRKRID